MIDDFTKDFYKIFKNKHRDSNYVSGIKSTISICHEQYPASVRFRLEIKV